MKSLLSTHAFSLHEFKVISLWSVVAYLAGNVIGNLFLFIIGTSSFFLFLPVAVLYGFAYGYCAFEAVKRLKGKTKLSGLSISLYMAGVVTLLSLLIKIFVAVAFGYDFHFSSNLAGVIGFLIGGYMADKKVVSKNHHHRTKTQI